MFVVMGASGHIGSVIVEDLLARKEAVLALIHAPEKAADLESKGAKTFVVDARDPRRPEGRIQARSLRLPAQPAMQRHGLHTVSEQQAGADPEKPIRKPRTKKS